jgi:hypothetical protein
MVMRGPGANQITNMKTNSENGLVLLMAVAVLFGVSQAGVAQPAFSVSPSVTNNAYSGAITLNITGLSNGEQVIVQRWIDLNGNGVIDAGEPMMDSFKIKDNGAMTIGGITNVSVPYDANPAAGAITTTLGFSVSMPLENMVGSYVYRIVSPSNNFSPVTATFMVTGAATGQTISGTVYDNGVPFPNAVVVAQGQQANNIAGAVVADSNGQYTMSVPPGNYNLMSVMPNTFFDQAFSPFVSLTNGQSSTNDLFLTNGTVTISGNVHDAASSNAIPGVMVQMQSGSYFAVTFADTNGNYSSAVAPSMWKIQAVKERLSRRAYVVPQDTFQVDTTSGSISNANIALPKGTALYYGRIVDNSNTAYPNIEVDGGTGNNFGCKGYSDGNGYYGVAVLGDLTNDWNCNISSAKGTALANFIINSFSTTNLSPGETIFQNFVPLPATDTISGHVQDNSGNPVSGVTLTAGAMINGGNYQALDSTTDNSGDYSLAVAPGQWSVQFLNGGFSDNLDAHGFVDYFMPHNVSVPPGNQTLNLTVYPIGTPFINSPQRISPTQFGFVLNGASNVNYTVLVSSDPSSTNWAPLFSLQLTNTSTWLVDVNATNSPRFYRVRKD